MIRAFIVDDEKPARQLLRKYLSDLDGLTIAGEYDNGFDALKAINDLKPDLVFLDIQMPKLNGLEIIELLDHVPGIIFTTAYDQYAVKAFEKNAVDYLLKPFSTDRLREAVTRFMQRHQEEQAREEYFKNVQYGAEESFDAIERVVVKTGSRIRIIYVDDIHYLESQDDYVMIYLEGEKHLKQQTMKYFETHLPKDRFLRIHRSYMVSIDMIEQIELYEKESYQVRLKSGNTLPVSKSGYARMRERLNF